MIPTTDGSKIHFVIKNFALNTGGNFTGLKGLIRFAAANISTAAFDVTVNAATVDTDNKTRDEHLKKEAYFDVTKYTSIHLVSTKIEKANKPGTYLFTGNLTIKGISKPIKFPFTENKIRMAYCLQVILTLTAEILMWEETSFPRR